MRMRTSLVAATLAGLLVAGATGAAASGTSIRTVGATAAAAVPWGSVGPGWTLAVWSPNKPVGPGEPAPKGNAQNPPFTVYLVSPSGARYRINRTALHDIRLEAWAGDATRALLIEPSDSATLRQLDLSTGTVSTAFTVPTSGTVFFETATYTKPDGLAVLVELQRHDVQVLERYSLNGNLELTYPRLFSTVGAYGGAYIESPNGLEVVLGAQRGLAVLANDGSVIGQVVLHGALSCSPVRWWRSGVVLASCRLSESTSRLYEIPVDGGHVTDLTASPVGEDVQDEDAWPVAGSVYLQDAGGCGYQYLAKLRPATRTTTPVEVPRVADGDSVFVIGATASTLDLQATIACGSGQSLLRFDPTADTSTVLLGPPVTGGGVIAALPYPSAGAATPLG